MEKNCLDCFYANYDSVAIMLQDFTNEEQRKCEHPNSPFYNEMVGCDNICRLFLDEKEYFRNIDLREKLIKLKGKNK